MWQTREERERERETVVENVSVGSDEDWKKTVGVKRRGMERRWESQWGWRGSWGEGKKQDESNQSEEMSKTPTILVFFLKFLLAALHIYLQSWMQDDWLTTTDLFDPGRCEARSSAGDVHMKSGHACRCMVIWLKQSRVSHQQHHQLAVEQRKAHPCMIKSSFRSVWRQKKSYKINPHLVPPLSRRAKATCKTTTSKLKRYAKSHSSPQKPSLMLIFVASMNN